MNFGKPALRSILFLTFVAIGTTPGLVSADVEIDLGRGPVTVHVPPTYDPAEPAPLVMLLHGYSASGEQQENYVQFLPWSDQLGFLYVYPDGTVDQDGYQFWNATDACCDFYDAGVDDSGYLRALVEAIIDELNVDTDRIYLFGISNGGFMAYRMACDHADLISAIASLAGATYIDETECNPAVPVRTLQIHGSSDGIVYYDGGVTDTGPILTEPYPGAVETTETWAAYNGCSLEPDLSWPPLDLDRMLPGHETTVARYANGCAAGGSSELWTIVGAGHDPNLSGDFAPLVLEFFFSDGGPSALLLHRSYIPAVAYASGTQGSFYQTDIDVSNSGDTAGRYRFLWLPRGSDNSEPVASEEFELGAGQSVRYTNAVHEIFGLEPDSLGAMAIEASTPELLFMSRTYNLEDGGAGGTFGQAIQAVGAHEMIPGGESRRIILASENEQYRTNVGCQNGSDGSTVVNLELFDADGTSLANDIMILRPWSNDQANRLFEDFQPVNGYVDVSTGVVTMSFYCYGSVLDNMTNDPTTIPPQ